MDHLKSDIAQFKEETRVLTLNCTNQVHHSFFHAAYNKIALLQAKLEKCQTDSIFWYALVP